MESNPRDEADNGPFLSWDELVAAKANGWVAVVIMTRLKLKGGTETWPWVVGPYATKREATNACNRLRAKWRRERSEVGFKDHTATFAVRPAWKSTE